MTLLLNRELISRAKLCLVSVFPDGTIDCPKIRNLPKIFQRSFENVSHNVQTKLKLVLEALYRMQLGNGSDLVCSLESPNGAIILPS